VLAPDVNFFLNSRKQGWLPCWRSLFFSFHRVPYELRICTKCNWHCAQDEEHVLLDFLSADLVNLRVEHHQLFRSPLVAKQAKRLH